MRLSKKVGVLQLPALPAGRGTDRSIEWGRSLLQDDGLQFVQVLALAQIQQALAENGVMSWAMWTQRLFTDGQRTCFICPYRTQMSPIASETWIVAEWMST